MERAILRGVIFGLPYNTWLLIAVVILLLRVIFLLRVLVVVSAASRPHTNLSSEIADGIEEAAHRKEVQEKRESELIDFSKP